METMGACRMHQRLGQAARPHCKLMSQIFHGWMNGRTALASWYITLVADSIVFLADTEFG